MTKEEYLALSPDDKIYKYGLYQCARIFTNSSAVGHARIHTGVGTLVTLSEMQEFLSWFTIDEFKAIMIGCMFALGGNSQPLKNLELFILAKNGEL